MSGRGELNWTERLARHGEEREAVVLDGARISYHRLARLSRTIGDGLSDLGIEPGDTVAVLAPASIVGVGLIHAMIERRVVLFPLNSRLAEREQSKALARTGALFLASSEDADAERVARLCESAGCGSIIFSSGGSPSQPTAELRCVRRPNRIRSDARLLRRTRRLDEGAALVLHTSGTSGEPKGAVLTLENLVASARASTELLGNDPHDRWLLCMPLFHIGGLSILIRSALFGTSVVLHRQFEAAHVSQALDEEQITRVSLVATMLSKLLDYRGVRRSPESLRLVLLGGGPAAQSLLERAHALGYPLAPTYGLTEAASQVATRPPEPTKTHVGDLSAGLVCLPGVRVRIVDTGGVALEPEREGEIQIRGPVVMKSYLDDEKATDAAFVDGWLATGDIGRLDARGRLRVLDRRQDLIVSGGENIYPTEIESVIASHPDVEDSAVVGVPDEEFGARPLAFVVLRRGASLDRGGLESFCRERLGGYKMPSDFVELSELPRTASGKLLRRSLAVDRGRT